MSSCLRAIESSCRRAIESSCRRIFFLIVGESDRINSRVNSDGIRQHIADVKNGANLDRHRSSG
jgi:hypothetical protein